MEPSRVDSIATWPVSHIFREIQVFFSFANFYWRFIDGFSHVASGLSDMLKSGVKGKFNNKDFAMTAKTLKAFNKLKKRFTMAFMLVYYKPKRQITLETDASAFMISGIISQLIKILGQWHPVAFWSQRMRPVEFNYGVKESKMLTIVETCKHWHHYLEGATYQVWVVTNHYNLRIFLMSKNLLQHEARWWERFLSLDLAIEYCTEGKNLANGLFCRPDYIKLDEDKQIMYIVGYITRSSTKNECTQNTAEDVQAPDSTKVTSKPN